MNQSSPTPTNAPVSNLRRFVDFVVAPRSKNRDEAFRERTIRITIAVVGVLLALNLLVSFIVFRDDLTFPSYPEMELLLLILCIIGGFAVSRQGILIAGVVVVLMVGAAAVNIALIPDPLNASEPTAILAFMLTILAAALVLPRSAIFPVTVLCIVGTAMILRNQALIAGTTTDYIAQAIFLWLLRGEFDSRLAAERASAEAAHAARLEADKANRAKSHFLANMTHEFRTPLNAIIGYTDLMLMGVVGEIPEKPKELLGFVKINAQRHLGLVNEVLDMSAIEAGKIDVHIKPENIAQLVTTTVDSLLSLAQQKQLSLKTTVESSMPTDPIRTDGKKIEQIVTNLVGNAVKFTTTGGIEVILGSSQPSDWYLKVKDTGRGMPKDAKEYIFETFRQVESNDAADHQGTGLGLAITLGLVKVIGGTIDVDSEVGKGSTFTVTFPRNPTMGAAENVSPAPLGAVMTGKSENPVQAIAK